jgi:hypothetical protein
MVGVGFVGDARIATSAYGKTPASRQRAGFAWMRGQRISLAPRPIFSVALIIRRRYGSRVAVILSPAMAKSLLGLAHPEE